MRHLSSTVFAATVLMLVSTPAQSEERCGGDFQIHKKSTISFMTSSSFEVATPLNRYWTCVSNPNTDKFLLVSWWIPGPHQTYVLPNETLSFPRRSPDADARPLNGCLQYGHLGELTVAEFIGDQAESDATQNDAELACKQRSGAIMKASSVNTFTAPEDGWSDSLRINFPSNAKEPEKTMLTLEAFYGVKKTSDSYRVYFEYFTYRPDGINGGSFEDVTYQVEFAPSDEYLSAVFSEFVGKEPKRLGEKGGYSFAVDLTDTYQVAPMSVVFSDVSGARVANVQLVALTPAR